MALAKTTVTTLAPRRARLEGTELADTLRGGALDDLIQAGGGDDLVWGGLGNDTLLGGAGRDTLRGETGADSLQGGDGDDQLEGGLGHDRLLGEAGNDALLGGDGDDRLEGGLGHDRLHGDAGPDTLRGGEGNDTVEAGAGEDSLEGGAGADVLRGDAGHDLVMAGDGNDQCWGGEGNDTLRTGTGADRLQGNGGDDMLCGAWGDDTCLGEQGDDILWGGDGNDFLQASDGNDLVIGGPGSDHMTACYGADFLLSRSDAGEPVIAASPSTPRVMEGIVLGGADDVMDGGPGPDTFRFELLVNARAPVIARNLNADGSIDWQRVTLENGALHDHWVEGLGNDVIRDYSRQQDDRIEVFGHEVELAGIARRDVNGDGLLESVVTLRAAAAAGGAHDGDALGSITVFGDEVTAADILLRADQVIGAFSRPELGPLPDERFGLLPIGWTGPSDWAGP